jgi:hypothetical protein
MPMGGVWEHHATVGQRLHCAVLARALRKCDRVDERRLQRELFSQPGVLLCEWLYKKRRGHRLSAGIFLCWGWERQGALRCRTLWRGHGADLERLQWPVRCHQRVCVSIRGHEFEWRGVRAGILLQLGVGQPWGDRGNTVPAWSLRELHEARRSDMYWTVRGRSVRQFGGSKQRFVYSCMHCRRGPLLSRGEHGDHRGNVSPRLLLRGYSE